MSLSDDLVAASAGLPVRLAPQKDGSLKGEAVLAERKAFLSKKKITYTCKARVDDAARTVRFWEMLIEKGSGMSSGMDDVGPGHRLLGRDLQDRRQGAVGHDRGGVEPLRQGLRLPVGLRRRAHGAAAGRGGRRVRLGDGAEPEVGLTAGAARVGGACGRTSAGRAGIFGAAHAAAVRRQPRFSISTGSISSAGANPHTRP